MVGGQAPSLHQELQKQLASQQVILGGGTPSPSAATSKVLSFILCPQGIPLAPQWSFTHTYTDKEVWAAFKCVMLESLKSLFVALCLSCFRCGPMCWSQEEWIVLTSSLDMAMTTVTSIGVGVCEANCLKEVVHSYFLNMFIAWITLWMSGREEEEAEGEWFQVWRDGMDCACSWCNSMGRIGQIFYATTPTSFPQLLDRSSSTDLSFVMVFEITLRL